MADNFLLLALTRLIYYTFIVSFAYLFYSLIQTLMQWKENVKFYEKIDGPSPGWPFLGNVSLFTHPDMNASEAMYLIFLDLAKKYGRRGIFKLFIGNDPVIYLTRPETAKAILSDPVNINSTIEYTYHEPWIRNGLVLSSGEKWKSRRKLISKGFHVNIVDLYIPIINGSYHIFHKLISKYVDSKVDIFEYVENFSLDALCETFMGVKLHIQEDPNCLYLRAAKDASDAITERFVSLLNKYEFFFWRSELGKKYRRSVDILHDFSEKIIRERRKVVEENLRKGIDLEKLNKRFCIVDFLLYECLQNNSIDEEGIREEIDTLILGGFETSRANICWTLYLLGNHVDIQEKAVQELKEVFGEGDLRDVTIEDLKHLNYIECITKESLRLYPTVPQIGRCLVTDLEIGGTVFPKGTNLWVNFSAIHRCEDIYPNPNRFDPDRFLPENSRGRDPNAFLPFAAGVRNCIGQRFAMLEIKLFLANFLRNFSVTCDTPMEKIIPVLKSTLVPKDSIPVNLKARKF